MGSLCCYSTYIQTTDNNLLQANLVLDVVLFPYYLNTIPRRYVGLTLDILLLDLRGPLANMP